MLTNRYHLGTMIGLFLALGVGIFIGGTLGQQWVLSAENSTVKMLMSKYDKVITVNQKLEKELSSLTLIHQYAAPALQEKTVLWIGPEHEHTALLRSALQAEGAKLVRRSVVEGARDTQLADDRLPDFVILTDSSARPAIEEAMAGVQESARIIEWNEKTNRLEDPREIADLITYMSKLPEDHADEALHLHRNASLE